jgi:hypothetical protein
MASESQIFFFLVRGLLYVSSRRSTRALNQEDPMRPSLLRPPRWLLGAALALSSACDGGSSTGQGAGAGSGEFVSDFPPSAIEGGIRGGTAAGAPSVSDEAADTAANGDATRAIVEADVIQLAGDRLYALSRISGLSVVDVSNPRALKLLGRYRDLPGTPFEMYLRGSVVVAMFSDWGQYVEDGDGYSFVQTSKVVAIDVADPAAMTALDDFAVPGAISDSRIVGDVLYVVGHEDGYCWGCADQKPQTTVVSLDVKNARDVKKVDALAFSDATNSYGWWQRSVTVNDQRMYVAGPEYGQNGPVGSSIQVIDISDPSGDLVEGAVIEAEGQVSSRWQVDEHEGVLRVLSQPGSWSGGSLPQPVLATYTVASSSDVRPLGRLPLVVPNPREQLQSVRFDGLRGYAITAERRDPLFTLDLSDPARPAQKGELEMPGFVYHMEPRGDRMWGLGFDQGNPAGGITVTLFDVADLTTPKLLSRVNFGGSWGSLPEDQDRIHKVFRVLDELGLVLVPFSGWDWGSGFDAKTCVSPYQSGVQLVSFANDTLTLEGMAPSRGEARRAFVHRDHLFSVSDASVDSFDITDRKQPAAKGNLSVAQYVTHALPLAGGVVARVNQDYWSSSPYVDFVAPADVAAPQEALGRIDLAAALADEGACTSAVYLQKAFARGGDVFVTYSRYVQGSYDTGRDYQGVLRIDASDPSAPTLAGRSEWSTQESCAGKADCVDYWYAYDGFYDYGAYNPARTAVVQVGSAVVLLETGSLYRPTGSDTKLRLRVVDFSSDEPTSTLLPLPSASYGGLAVSGDQIMLGRLEETSVTGRVRFFVQELDLSEPTAPSLGDAINVPGSLMHYDAAHGRIVTSQLTRKPSETLTYEECDTRYGYFEFDYPNVAVSSNEAPQGTCTGYTQTLHLVRLAGDRATLDGSYTLDATKVVSSSALGDDRVFAVLNDSYAGYWRYAAVDCFGPCGGGYGAGVTSPAELLTLSGLASGELSHGLLTVDGLDQPWWGFWGGLPVYASGTRAILTSSGDLAIVDGSDAAAPKLVRTDALYGSVSNVAFAGDEAFVALGEGGAERISLR